VAGAISNLLKVLPGDVYEVELEIGRDGRVFAVVERWTDKDGKTVERRRRLVKRFLWLF